MRKLKKGQKHLVDVSGLNNGHSSMLAETLVIMDVKGSICLSQGVKSKNNYTLRIKEFNSRKMYKTKKNLSRTLLQWILLLLLMVVGLFGVYNKYFY